LAALAHHGVVIRAVIGEVTNADLPGEIVVRKQGITAQG
jgi:hypothetical protein